jgi:hypothetical protein
MEGAESTLMAICGSRAAVNEVQAIGGQSEILEEFFWRTTFLDVMV